MGFPQGKLWYFSPSRHYQKFSGCFSNRILLHPSTAWWNLIHSGTLGRNHKCDHARWLVLCNKIRLHEKEAAATAIGIPGNTFQSLTLNIEPLFWPQSLLSDDDFHALEPSWHCWVVIWEIQLLSDSLISMFKCCVLHSWTTFVLAPCCMRVFW